MTEQKTGYGLLILLGIVVTALIWGLWTQSHWLAGSPLENEREIEPKIGVTDDDGYLYVADLLGNSIVMLDPERDMTIVDTFVFEESHVSLMTEIVAGDDGRLYLIQNRQDRTATDPYSQELIRLDPGTGEKDLIYSAGAAEEEAISRFTQLSGLSKTTQGDIRFTVHQTAGLQSHLIDTDGEVREDGPVMATPGISEWFFAAGSPEHGFTGVSQESEIFSIDDSGLTRIFPEIDNLSVVPAIGHVQYDASAHGLAFLDEAGKSWLTIGDVNQGGVETAFTEADLEAQGFTGSIRDVVIHRPTAGSTRYLLTENRIAEVAGNNQIQQYFIEFPRSSTELFFHYAVWVVAGITLILTVYFLRRFYLDVINNRIPIAIKQVALFTPAMIAGILVLMYFINEDVVNQIQAESERELRIHVANGQTAISTTNLSGLNSPGQFQDATYNQLSESVEQAFAAIINDNENRYAYTLYRYTGSELRAVMNNDAFKQSAFFSPMEEEDLLRTVSEGTQIIGTHDQTGVLRMAGPVETPLGETVGVYEVSKDLALQSQDGFTLMQDNWQLLSAILASLILFFILVTVILLRPLRKLRNAVEQFAAGDWNSRVYIRSKDEIQDLSDRFNEMADKISTSVEEVSLMKDAYYRFVPQQFLDFLGKEQLHELTLGDQVQKEMHVMLISLHAKEDVRAAQTPEETFHDINGFFGKTGPLLRQYQGLVSHYRGSSILALFPGRSEDALRAAEAVIEAHEEHLKSYNSQVHISLHYGPVMLGIIGEEERLAGTSIGHTVSEAEGMDLLAQGLSASILLTDSAIADTESRRQIRYLGQVKFAAVDKMVDLYDDFSADQEETRNLKEKTKETFEQGVSWYQEGRFLDARMVFVQVIRINPFDLAAKNGFFLSDYYYQYGTPPGWNGSLVLYEGEQELKEAEVLAE